LTAMCISPPLFSFLFFTRYDGVPVRGKSFFLSSPCSAPSFFPFHHFWRTIAAFFDRRLPRTSARSCFFNRLFFFRSEEILRFISTDDRSPRGTSTPSFFLFERLSFFPLLVRQAHPFHKSFQQAGMPPTPLLQRNGPFLLLTKCTLLTAEREFSPSVPIIR